MSRLQKGLHLHLDPQSGIAGDMTVAALVDAGVPRPAVLEAIRAMGVRGLEARFERRKRGAFVGTGFVVTWPGMPGAARARRSTKARPTARPPRRGRNAVAHGHHGHEHDPDQPHAHAHPHPQAHGAHEHDHGPHGHHHDHPHDPVNDPHALLHNPRTRHTHRHEDQFHTGGDHGHDHGRGNTHGHDPDHAHDHDHRDYAEIRRLLKRAKLDPDVRELAGEVFAEIARVESALHGVPVDRIAFHEVGAYDSIADVVGAAAAIAWLAPTSISCSPPVLGTGFVRTAHGRVAVPAPATAELLAGVPVRAEGEGELTTPTGAAILASVVDRFGSLPPMRLHAQGMGAGTRELADRPNLLRVMLGQPLGEALPESAPSVTLLESNIDDMSPQLIEPLLAALFAAGAVDAWSTPILMKKGRPAFTVSALAPAEAVEAVARAFFENSTTIGLRSLPLGRTVLARSRAQVKTAFGNVAVKLSALDGQVVAATPEFDDCRRLAKAGHAPVRAVLAAATAAAAYQFGLAGAREGTRGKR